MIELYCGAAAEAVRSALVGGSASDALRQDPAETTLIVVPDELIAKAVWRRRTAAALVISFDELLSVVIRTRPQWPDRHVTDGVSRAVIRNIIENSPEDFDHLVGRYSVPRISQGVLSRIMAAVQSLQNRVQTEEEQGNGESPRWRQIKLLNERFEQRLADASISREQLAVWQGIIDLSEEDWSAAFPAVETVIFADFTSFADEVYLSIAAISKKVALCQVILDFDPEDDAQATSPLEASYQRLHDMADMIFNEADTPAERASAVVVTAKTVGLEVSAIGRVIEKLRRDADKDALPRIVCVIPDTEGYAAQTEKVLNENNILWKWMTPVAVAHRPEMMLLERLRACTSPRVSGAEVADLFRAPGFGVLFTEPVNTVEAWDMASRLNYVLTLTGGITGWASILKQVRTAFTNLQNQRKRGRHWSDEEKALDDRLLEVLGALAETVKEFAGEQPLSHWTSKTAELFAKVADMAGTPKEAEVATLGSNALQAALRDLAAGGDAAATGPIRFAYFVTLFRTVIHGVTVQPDLPETASHVLLCTAELAANLTGDVCIVAGFNDGNFPRFARPEASFLSRDIHKDQRPARARQWNMLCRILSRYRAVQLWTPERAGTEELLPSLFTEILISSGWATEIAADNFLSVMECREQTLRDTASEQFARFLKGLELSHDELQRFAAAGNGVYNAARGISILAYRDNPGLSEYDGIVTDPRLQAWLTAWVDRHTFSVSQLDGIVGCSFRFFVDRMLNLDEPEEADDLLSAAAFGSFAHDVLARFYRSWVAAGRSTLRSADEVLAREELLRAYYAEYDPEDSLSTFARDLMNLKLFGVLGPEQFGMASPTLAEVSDAGVFGKFLLLEMQRGEAPGMDFLHPSNFEVGFGVTMSEEEDPLSTPESLVMDVGHGNTVRLWGRIDRIDVSKTGVFAVTDYKTGHLPTGTEIAGGFRTQLPVYMLVAQELLKKKYDEPQPAGGLYYSLKRGKAAKISGVFVRQAFQHQLGVTGRGMSDDKFMETLDMVKARISHSMTALRRGYLTTTHHNPDTVCRYCAYQKLCYRNVERTAVFWQAVEAKEMSDQSE